MHFNRLRERLVTITSNDMWNLEYVAHVGCRADGRIEAAEIARTAIAKENTDE